MSNNKIDSLKQALAGAKPVTVADASAKSGLSLHDTKSGLNELVAEYRGDLSVTSDGELIYSFPFGFEKPWESRERLSRLWQKIKKASLGALKFLVRAWISIIMVGYVVIFALILLALTFSKSSDRDNDSGSLSSTLMFHSLFRLLMDSLFWTFHPFSPFYVGRDPYFDHYPKKQKMPFYEKVNRFFFGPEEKPVDEQELTRIAMQEIRAQKGRIGVIDLMRVTGLSKEDADNFMARLMVNHEGDVQVSAMGGIYYEFPQMRKTALNEQVFSPPSVWQRRDVVPPFTGNEAGSNILIAGLNGFNLLMSSVAIANSWTIEKLRYIFYVSSSRMPAELLPPPPPDSMPLILGLIPFVFSLALFLIPITRAMFRGKKKHEVDVKNGRKGLLKAILSKFSIGGIKEESLRDAWTEVAQSPPSERVLVQEIIKLGGEMESDKALYRFNDIETELKALEGARSSAKESEAKVGEVIFSSAR
jgi:hypothetical protein